MSEPTTAIETWQLLCGAWTDSRFPDDTMKDRGLILGEESGEVQRCIIKAAQNIRGGTDHWNAELRKETAQTFFALCALAHRAGFDLADAIEAEWDNQRDKTYATGPVSS